MGLGIRRRPQCERRPDGRLVQRQRALLWDGCRHGLSLGVRHDDRLCDGGRHTNWNVTQGLGSGRSDVAQGGAYALTHFGPAYLAGALSFGNHWMTINGAVVPKSVAIATAG